MEYQYNDLIYVIDNWDTEGIKVVRMKNEDVYDFNYPKEIFKKAKKKVVS